MDYYEHIGLGEYECVSELYELYCENLRVAADRARRDVPAGPIQDRLVAFCTPEPLEHFEAKVAELASQGRLERYVDLLRNGFDAFA